MAQPQQPRYPTLPPQQPMSGYYNPAPPPRLPSPGGGSGVQYQPNKRPRLSPNPTSPYPQSPTAYTGSIYLSSSYPQQPPFHSPQPVQPPSDATMNSLNKPVMGPPARPDKEKEKQQKEKGTNVEDLSDVLALAGVDVKDEESALTQYNLHGSQSFSSNTATPGQSFGAYPYGQLPTGAGPLSQAAQTEQSVEDEVYRRHKNAARSLSENRAKELNSPFLQANAIRRRLQGKAWEMGVKVNVDGLFDPIKAETPKSTSTSALIDGQQANGVVSVSQPSLLEENSTFAEMLSLLSLAANERIRTLLEDAFRISRGRQVSSQGVVTPGFESLATGNGVPKSISAIPQNVTGTAWEEAPPSAISPMTLIPQKRPGDTLPNNLPTPPTEPSSSPKRAPMPTISYPNQSAQALRNLASSERDFEKARLARRAKRQRVAASTQDKADDTVPMEDIKPVEPKMTKKERERLAKQGQTEEVLQRQANATASMALGKSRYSWMNAAASAASAGGIGTGAGVGKLSTSVTSSRTAAGSDATGGTNASNTSGPDKNLVARDRRFGDWREDEGRDAKKIVIRDWISVLERDGMEKKALAKAISKLGQPFVMRSATLPQSAGASSVPSAVGTPSQQLGTASPVVTTPAVGTPAIGTPAAVTPGGGGL